MLYELSTLVATAGSTNRPVLQARDRDPLHQHQVKNDKKRCFTNGYDSQYLSHGLFTHLDWIGDLDHRTMADSNSTYTLDILTQTIRHAHRGGIVKFHVQSISQTNKHQMECHKKSGGESSGILPSIPGYVR